MKRMLINASQPEEVRVALVDGQWLYDLDIENQQREQKKSNIYKGKITRVEPSLEAAFVDYGAERHGFLPLKEISREYFVKQDGKSDRGRIKDLVKEGTEVIVQVDKEERGNKGAALTTFISLAGRYLVLMPNNPRGGGISRRIDGEDRSQLKEALSSLDMPKGMSIIVRTAGVGRSAIDLQNDFNYLVRVWQSIIDASSGVSAPKFLFQESNVIIRAIRDYLRPDIGEVIVDTNESFSRALQFVQQVMPQEKHKIKHYNDEVPLFNRYQIEGQIETAFEREVKLPSGGSIVIDPTEALVSIDINSARATKGGDIEETALATNLEAADEIARQMRLRDIGGLVVIDFIDMHPDRNRREVENRMRDALGMDRARVQIGKISRFGLLEMSRQRLRPSLEETTSKMCPRCTGQGTIRSTRSLALSILRIVEEEAKKERSAEIRTVVPVPVATYLLNEKRTAISNIESRHSTRVVILPNEHMVTPHYEVTRLRDDEVEGADQSYKIEVSDPHASELEEEKKAENFVPAKPLVSQVSPPPPVTTVADNKAPEASSEKSEPGLIAKLLELVIGFFKSKPEEPAPKASENRGHQKRRGGNNQRRSRNGNRNQRHNNRRDHRQNQNDSDEIVDNLSGENIYQDTEKQQDRERPQNKNRRNRRRGGQNRSDNNEGATSETNNTEGNTSENENQPPKRPSNRRGRTQERQRGAASEAQETETATQAPAAKAPAKAAESNNDEAQTERPARRRRSRGNGNKRKDAETTSNDNAGNDNQNTATQDDSTTKPVEASAKAEKAHVDTAATKEEAKNLEPKASTPEKAADAVATPAAAQAEAALKEALAATPKEKVKEQEPAAKATEEVQTASTPEPEATTPPEEKPAPKAEEPETKAEPTATAKESSEATTYVRANNDPRTNPKPVANLAITTLESQITKGLPLDTALAADIKRSPRALGRASNDPRGPLATKINEEETKESQV
ncbi:ribonuclease E [Marinagarivorans cellulosilyticus]|uniref:Ribonuclease E n=1 Tax=Marinagarivorans cellulosilyticus TaxID=2721545 RepID=A0AAN1WHG0_9GAMM|nr:ribonuclease E [Marinagarivorans cellulosilyticus]BCD97634.1 ribonuclease E [Marinagarivorans cellulosilyticus]